MPLSNGASREPATPIGKKRKTRSAPKRRRTKAKRAVGKGRRKMTAKQAKYFGKRKRRKRRA